MQYIKGVAERVQTILKHDSVKVYSKKSYDFTKNVCKMSNKFELGDNKNVVYSVSCSVGDGNARYQGESRRAAKWRN